MHEEVGHNVARVETFKKKNLQLAPAKSRIFWIWVICAAALWSGVYARVSMGLPLRSEILYLMLGITFVSLKGLVVFRLFQLQNMLKKERERVNAVLARESTLDRTKAEFVSIAAHQLRTPLTGIKWALNYLREEFQGYNDEQKKIIDEAFHATERLVLIINDLLNVARIEEGRFGIKSRVQPILPILQNIAFEIRKMAEEKGIEFSFEAGELPELSFDEEKITMVLENLLGNSVKYTSPGGKIIFKCGVKDNKALFEIRDTGIGIPKKDFPNVFSKFFRSANAQLYHTTGTGLGLNVAKNIIEQHKGSIWFESEEGKGSTFYFALPLSKINPEG